MLDEPIMNYDISDALSLLNTEKIERCFKELTHDLDVGLRLIKNADVVFVRATQKLEMAQWFCLASALLAAVGGMGAALCKRENKKTRAAFAFLALLGAGLSLLSAYIVFKMHASLIRLQPLVQRRWN